MALKPSDTSSSAVAEAHTKSAADATTKPATRRELTFPIDEAQETLSAIRNGEVDALVISASEDPRVFVLEGADHAHRTLLETLNEGALTVTGDGMILFANRKLAEMLGKTSEDVLGTRLGQFVEPGDSEVLTRLLDRATKGSSKGEISLVRADGERTPVMLSIRAVSEVDVALTVVATDLTQLKAANAALARANDELEARVAARTVELLQANEALRAEITVRERLEHELRSKAEALLSADRRKDEFLSMLAHELRNPLAPILTAAEMIRHMSGGNTSVERYRGVIERQVRNLTRIVDDLLDVSRITRGAITLQTKPIDLASVIRSAVDAARPLIDAGKHTLSVEVPTTPLPLIGDPTRLEQVLVNLLNNAAKYTDRGGAIALCVEVVQGHVVVRVRDTGVGMPQDLLPHVFDLFVQGSRSLDRSQGGLGIGLTLVKRLVEMHGGRVQAFSEGAGKGSEIAVHLPSVPSEPTQASVLSRMAGVRMGGDDGARRVLLIEDNVDACEMLTEVLKLWGCEVLPVQSGETAVELAEQFRPHIVLLDIGLPGVDGFEVARRLRAAGSTVPIQAAPSPLLIGISGYGQPLDRHRAREAGIDHHLVKPLDPQVLLDLLAQNGHAELRSVD